MNKNYYLVIAGFLLVVLISVWGLNSITNSGTYAAEDIKEKAVVDNISETAEETDVKTEPENEGSEEVVPVPEAPAEMKETEPVKTLPAVLPAKETPKTETPSQTQSPPVKSEPASVSKPVHETSPTVSRGATDINKYPKLSKVNGKFGQFRYRELGGGRIEVDPNWVAENIVTITLPGLNQKVQVHKEAQDQFLMAFNIINSESVWINGKEVPLLSLIKTMDGTYVPRHINWDSSRGLSNHSWGSAIDINAKDHFRYVDAAKEKNNPNLILWEKAFKPAGFSWGNSYNDAMHYEILK